MSLHVPLVAPTSRNKLEMVALQHLFNFNTDVLSAPQSLDIELLFEKYLPSIVSELETTQEYLPDSAEGYTEVLADGKARSVVSLNLWERSGVDINARRRLRSTIAHETGHVLVHVPQWRQSTVYFKSMQQEGIAHVKRSDIPLYQDPEWQAHAIAGSLLMPRDAVSALLEEGVDVVGMSSVFDVHPAFVRSRLKALGML